MEDSIARSIHEENLKIGSERGDGEEAAADGGGTCLQPAEQVGGLLAVLFAEVRDQSLVLLYLELAGCRHLPAKGRGDSHFRQELARLCKNTEKQVRHAQAAAAQM
jgi:hypothetical protein